MTNTRDIIIKLKEVREEKGLSYNDILSLLEKNNEYLAKSTIARVFGEGSEDLSFRYEETIRPIANALLDIETFEETDDLDTKAMKSLLKYKIERIEELEDLLRQAKEDLANEKVKYHERLDKEREQHNRSIEFLKEQVSLKDKRMDLLLDAVVEKDKQHKEMLERILVCSKCPVGNKYEG